MCTEMKKKCPLHSGNSRSCVRNTHKQFWAINITVYKGEHANRRVNCLELEVMVPEDSLSLEEVTSEHSRWLIWELFLLDLLLGNTWTWHLEVVRHLLRAWAHVSLLSGTLLSLTHRHKLLP